MAATDTRRLAPLLIAATFAAFMLAGCSDGTSTEAERGKEQDQQRTSVVADMEATRAARLLEPGTPPPPTSTP